MAYGSGNGGGGGGGGGDVPRTSNSVLHSAAHGRRRRSERNIDKVDLQRARRYGMEEPARNGRIKYTYGGVVFIYDPVRNREVTTYPSPDAGSSAESDGDGAARVSGTRSGARPVILPKREEWEDPLAMELRDLERKRVWRNQDSWTSHSVLVVDMSGSMRRDDVNGARCRSDGVWMALARDYVQLPLERKARSRTDVVSVVVMMEEARVVLKYEPTDWVLYNKLVDLREWTAIRPAGPGNYMPALDAAEALLMNNQRGSCSLSLLFFSDGRPSDRGDFAGRTGELAAKFGRRLSIACVGMAEPGEDFSTLNEMVTEANSFGAVASFGQPSLDADSLSNIITSLVSSLSTSKTEMTNAVTGKARKVRMDITRERVGTPDDEFITAEWIPYNSDDRYVKRFWSWDYKHNDFVRVLDSRCEECWKETFALDEDKPTLGFLCDGCEACYFCIGCYMRSTPLSRHTALRSRSRKSNCSDYLKKRRTGFIVRKPLPSRAVAVKQPIFGEGAERIVKKFRFLDEGGNFIGPVMVAKESRFVESDDAYEARMDYHREFMRTQAIASEMAKQFNEAIDGIHRHFSDRWVKREVDHMPRIKFLNPMVVETYDSTKHDEEYNILIEPMLEGKYEKLNDNMGMVKGESKSVNMDDLANALGNMGLDEGSPGNLHGLGAIEEGSEEEDSDDENIFHDKESRPSHGSYNFSSIKDSHFPQAFSHFSYEKSKKRFQVVDLQGVFKVNRDGTRCYELTDPVIHKHRKKNKSHYRQWTFGRTDRGEKGMKAFFHTHKCNEVCRLLGLEEVDSSTMIAS